MPKKVQETAVAVAKASKATQPKSIKGKAPIAKTSKKISKVVVPAKKVSAKNQKVPSKLAPAKQKKTLSLVPAKAPKKKADQKAKASAKPKVAPKARGSSKSSSKKALIKKVKKVPKKVLTDANGIPLPSKLQKPDPKKPATAFSYYCKEAMKNYQADSILKDKSGKEIRKILGERWNLLSQKDKLPYENFAIADVKRHKKELKFKYGPNVVLPKRPRSTYMMYLSETFKKFAQQKPTLKMVEISKMQAKYWHTMTDQQKQPFQKLAENDLVRFQKEINQLRTQGFFVNSDGIKSTDLKWNGKQKEFPSDTVLPKKATMPYVYFFQEQLPQIQKSKIAFTAGMKQTGELWHKLTDQQKQKYYQMTENDKIRYQKQMSDLRQNGYFILVDGKTKSTDRPQKTQTKAIIEPKKTDAEMKDQARKRSAPKSKSPRKGN